MKEQENHSKAPRSGTLTAYLLGINDLLKRYEQMKPLSTACEFPQEALNVLDISLDPQGESLDVLKEAGPAVIYANHPFGGVEGIILAHICCALRPDFKLLANHMLTIMPAFAPMIIPINVDAKSQRENIKAMRQAIDHVENGGALGIFPAGIVSHWQMKERKIVEPIWQKLIGRLTRLPNTKAIPVHFKGTNSFLFHALGCIHPFLRTINLPRELAKRIDTSISYEVGRPVDANILPKLVDDSARTAHLRARCDALARPTSIMNTVWDIPVASPDASDDLLNTCKAFLEKDTLATEGNFAVFAVRGSQSLCIMQEIGRLREETFRLVGEGSGQERDLDKYDNDYEHIVLWDTVKECIAGAYRVRVFRPEEAHESEEKLYLASLFDIKAEFYHKCQRSMELGRAFIGTEYQRDYVPLMLLWKGIGRFIVRNNLRTLFGPCSIGLGYTESSVHILRQLLKEHYWQDELANYAKGKLEPKPFSGPNVPNVQGLDYKTCNRIVNDLEGDKGLPILFKHYLQLNGRIAAFHEDQIFGTLDALLVVDLALTPEKILLRYMSKEELEDVRASYKSS